MESPFFLDIDKASSAFRLLFSFALDDACLEEEFYTFDNVVTEVLGGARLSGKVRERLEDLFYGIQEQDLCVDELLLQVSRDFGRDPDSLVAILAIILRMSSNEGMYCRRDKARVRRVVEAFDLSSTELEALPESDRRILRYCFETGDAELHSLDREDLDKHYEVLECSPDSPDDTLRKSYRRLVKRYHPDKLASTCSDVLEASRMHFEKIQFAYEQVQAARKRV